MRSHGQFCSALSLFWAHPVDLLGARETTLQSCFIASENRLPNAARASVETRSRSSFVDWLEDRA